MDVLEFVDEEKIVSLTTVSKSLFDTAEVCPLKAWYLKREGKKNEKLNDNLKLVRYVKDLFSREIAVVAGDKYKVNIKGLSPAIKYEGDLLLNRMNVNAILKESQILGYDLLDSVILKNGLNLMGSINLILMKEDPKQGPYLQVFLLKSGFKVSKVVDNEAIIYTYIVAKKYGLPVLFTRYSVRSGDEWGKFFTHKEALELEEGLIQYSSELKEMIESDERPEPCAGGHCTECPFLQKCKANELDETNLPELVNKYQWAAAYTKNLQERIKDFVAEREEPIEVKGYAVAMKESVSKAIKTKNITKQDLLVLFAKSGKLNLILDSVDLKITDTLIMRAKEEFGIEFKDVSRRSLMIETKTEKEEEEKEDE